MRADSARAGGSAMTVVGAEPEPRGRRGHRKPHRTRRSGTTNDRHQEVFRRRMEPLPALGLYAACDLGVN